MYLVKRNLLSQKELSRRPEIGEALKALEKLDGDTALRVYGEVFAGALEDSYSSCYGLTRSKGHACVGRVLNSRHNLAGSCLRPPGDDHASLWMWGKEPMVYVYQPYDLNLSELVDFSREHSLVMRVRPGAYGWHFPGRVFFVELTTEEKEKRLIDRAVDKRRNRPALDVMKETSE